MHGSEQVEAMIVGISSTLSEVTSGWTMVTLKNDSPTGCCTKGFSKLNGRYSEVMSNLVMTQVKQVLFS